jgi:hypothetical protein
MKRVFMALILLSAVLSSAQSQVCFGVKGGLNLSEMSFSENVFESSNRLGYFVGPSLKIALPLGGLGLDIAGFYERRDAKINGETIKQESIVVPANVRIDLAANPAFGIYLAAGPQLAFNIGDDEFKWKKEEIENTFQLKKSFFSVNLGGGIIISEHLEIGFTYNIGVSKTGDATWISTRDATLKSDDTKAKSYTLSAALYF